MKQSIEDFKDVDGNQISIGDTLDTLSSPNRFVKVVKTDDYETGFGFDLEDEEGDRIWNPYFAVEKMRIIPNPPSL